MNNEFTITINDNEFVLKPTWSVIKAIENSSLNISIMELAMNVMNSAIKTVDLVEIVFLSIKGQENAPNRDDIGEAVVEKGIAEYAVPVGKFLACSFAGSKEYEEALETVSSEPTEEGN